MAWLLIFTMIEQIKNLDTDLPKSYALPLFLEAEMANYVFKQSRQPCIF